ncbi:periplasmic binding protein-like I [Dichotomocladium elegans]|nr:periplasmic binding protein-like I [Dichotomocladium elegans]
MSRVESSFGDADSEYPDVQFQFIHYTSDFNNLGQTAWTTFKMVDDGINAVIGDMVSDMTEQEAGITGVRHIPHCSPASASLSLSDKEAYPYFFRTVGNVVLFGSSLVEWVRYMGWRRFALIYTNDDVGQQGLVWRVHADKDVFIVPFILSFEPVLAAMMQRAEEYHLEAMIQIPLYDMTRVQESLEALARSGSRIVIFADSNTEDQLTVLKSAMSLGLLSEGWVWMMTNDMSPAIRDMIESPEELAAYDGLMFISGLWNLTGIPAYDSLQTAWSRIPAPSNFTEPLAWQSSGLSYNAPNAYACAELLALGLDKALDNYPGGRSQGLVDLGAHKFSATSMTPTFYNLNYTGPAGLMEFSDTVTYATLMDNTFELLSNATVLYLGHTHTRPKDTVDRYALNPSLNSAFGLALLIICLLGLFCSLVMLVLILLFRRLKSIMISSPVFCCVQLVGIAMGYIGPLLYLDRPTPAKCIVRQFIITGGFQNVFTVRTSRLKSAYLLRIVGVLGVVAYIPLIFYNALYAVQVTENNIDATSTSFCWLCVYPGAPGDWVRMTAAQLVVLIWAVLLIIVAALLAFKTRKVRGKWAEANQVAYVSYNIALAACLASPSFFLSTDNYYVSVHLKLVAIVLGATCALVVIFVPKLAVIVQYLYSKYRDRLHWRRHETANDYGSAHYFDDLNDRSDQPHDDLATKNLLDFTVQAHEGVLPVKKLGRFSYMSIWELRHIVVVPLKRFFVLMNKQGGEAQMHYYLACEAISLSDDRCIFKVTTVDEKAFLFQVHDAVALRRWLQWFVGPMDPNAPSSDSSSGQVKSDEAPSGLPQPSLPTATVLDLYAASMHEPLATFGAALTSGANDSLIESSSRQYYRWQRRSSHQSDDLTSSLYTAMGYADPVIINESSDMLLQHQHRDISDMELPNSSGPRRQMASFSYADNASHDHHRLPFL